MAQLVKLLDYISRYESNPFHYPTQYIRLKQENWQRMNGLWEKENEIELEQPKVLTNNEENKRFFRWNPFQKRKEEEVEQTEQFERTLPRDRDKLTRYFLNELYPFQIKWATSTVSQVSYTDKKYTHDPILKQLLQRLPDIYLIMYYPIFNIKKAPVEGEIILISPIEVEIITLLREGSRSTIYAGTERTWSVETDNNVSKIVSPTIALKRTEQIIKGILKRYQIHFPIKKTVLSNTSSILFSEEPYNTSIVGKEKIEAWLEEKRILASPLKSEQLKTVESLLRHCQTTSVRRPEWEYSNDEYITPNTFKENE